ncbi:ribonuclease H [Hyphomicrobium sp. ghe19]|uniref:ribonuclease H family protein n=1 Tax=Hyphomicrobium sp. ghe19 TaxID=2682968 RepID=UPI0013674A2E|nr:Ribonuclease H [Hyphomicrobium sp. ghe19]
MRVQTTVAFEVDDPEYAGVVAADIANFLKDMQIAATVTPPKKVDSDIVVVYTDGGCDAKKGIGAWAYTVQEAGKPMQEVSGPMLNTTNNRMEMTAVIKVLQHLEIGRPILIHCDSEYVIKGVTQWSKNWQRNGWINSMGQPVVNRDLWEVLVKLYSLHSVMFKHVKGHSGIEGNERVDELCTMEMLNANSALIMSVPAEVHKIPTDTKGVA